MLTRLPSGLAVPAALGAAVLARRFDEPPLRLDDHDRRNLLARLADSGVSGGATYDGLVAIEAAAHGEPLITLDERAQVTYRRLGVAFEVLAV